MLSLSGKKGFKEAGLIGGINARAKKKRGWRGEKATERRIEEGHQRAGVLSSHRNKTSSWEVAVKPTGGKGGSTEGKEKIIIPSTKNTSWERENIKGKQEKRKETSSLPAHREKDTGVVNGNTKRLLLPSFKGETPWEGEGKLSKVAPPGGKPETGSLSIKRDGMPPCRSKKTPDKRRRS